MDFIDFLSHEDKDVRQAAQMLETVKQAYKDKMITESEFKEISQDVIETIKVQQHASSLERKILLEQAVDAFQQILELVKR